MKKTHISTADKINLIRHTLDILIDLMLIEWQIDKSLKGLIFRLFLFSLLILLRQRKHIEK